MAFGLPQITLWIAAGIIGMFSIPAFLSTIFAEDGPFDDLTGLVDAPQCRYTSVFLANVVSNPRDYSTDGATGNVVVASAIESPASILYTPLLTLVQQSDGTTAPPAVYSDIWPAPVHVRHYNPTPGIGWPSGDTYLASFIEELIVPSGTAIRYESTSHTTSVPIDPITDFNLGITTLEYFDGSDFSTGDFYWPVSGLAFGRITESDPFTTSNQMTIAYIESGATRIPIALAAGDADRVRQLMIDNGRNPDACDPSNGTLAQVRHADNTATTAADYEYGIVAQESVASSMLSNSAFRPVLAAMFVFIPLGVVLFALAQIVPRLRRG